MSLSGFNLRRARLEAEKKAHKFLEEEKQAVVEEVKEEVKEEAVVEEVEEVKVKKGKNK